MGVRHPSWGRGGAGTETHKQHSSLGPVFFQPFIAANKNKIWGLGGSWGSSEFVPPPNRSLLNSAPPVVGRGGGVSRFTQALVVQGAREGA